MNRLNVLLAGLVAAAGFAIAPPVCAQTLPQGIVAVTSVEGADEYRLANGLQLLLIPDDAKPTTTVNLTYRVGSRHENYGETGIAHLLEHLLFKGTPDRTADLTKEFHEARGMVAGTAPPTTSAPTITEQLHGERRDHLQFCAGAGWLMRMINSNVARKDLDSEMSVVRNEYGALVKTIRARVLFQRADARRACSTAHNYGKSTIGARAE